MRGGPGLGTIQPSQADYFQATKEVATATIVSIVLAPSTVQEMVDFVGLGFDLAFKYTNPLHDSGRRHRGTDDGEGGSSRTARTPHRRRDPPAVPLAASGRKDGRKRNVITSLEPERAAWR